MTSFADCYWITGRVNTQIMPSLRRKPKPQVGFGIKLARSTHKAWSRNSALVRLGFRVRGYGLGHYILYFMDGKGSMFIACPA